MAMLNNQRVYGILKYPKMKSRRGIDRRRLQVLLRVALQREAVASPALRQGGGCV